MRQVDKGASAISSVSGAKYEIGELADFIGVPDYYDNGTMQFMRTATWVPSASVGVNARLNLAKRASQVAMSTSALLASFYFLNALTPVAAAAAISCLPMNDAAGNLYSLTVDATGVNVQPVGATSGLANPTTVGGQSLITYDGANFWCWYAVTGSATVFKAKNSADGKTWATQAIAGLPVFNATTTDAIGPSGASFTSGLGDLFVSSTANKIQGAFWAGARHILIGTEATNTYFLASDSSNGTAWNGDKSVAVLGSATVAKGNHAWWYRNGNNAFLAIGAVSRYSTDGGVTWGNAGLSFANPLSGMHFRVNGSDATRILCDDGSASYQFSANSGQSWTARAKPSMGTITSIAYRGSAVLLCDGANVQVSTDDGVTWNPLTGIAGFTGNVRAVSADANRFYIHGSSNQICTSTNGTSWTVRNISTAELDTSACMYCAALDANNIVLASTTQVLYSTDGGVNWKHATPSTAITPGTGVIPITTGTSLFVQGKQGAQAAAPMLATDIVSGGAAYRAGTTVVTPLRTNALAFARVS